MEQKKFTVKFAETKEELDATFALRYKDMILEYNSESQNDQKRDRNIFDDIAKQIIVINNETNEVIGCYRLIDNAFFNESISTFTCENEFDISKIKNSGHRICELSRAVIKNEYRTGAPLILLWKFIYDYAIKNSIRFLLGDASFLGIEPSKHIHSLSYLAHHHAIEDEFEVTSLAEQPQIELLKKEHINVDEVKNNLPPLIKAYLTFGSKFSKEYFIDHDFKSIDVFTLLDFENCNLKLLKKYLRVA